MMWIPIPWNWKTGFIYKSRNFSFYYKSLWLCECWFNHYSCQVLLLQMNYSDFNLLAPGRCGNNFTTGSVFFIRPFEKRTYYAMAMSVRLSVRPSVRPSFPDFFSTCFEISIWNLVYALSRWHDMSSLSFITIGSLWPSLQPNVGQTQFLQS